MGAGSPCKQRALQGCWWLLGTLWHCWHPNMAPDHGSCPRGCARVAEPGQERSVAALREAGICRDSAGAVTPCWLCPSRNWSPCRSPPCSPPKAPPHIPPGWAQTQRSSLGRCWPGGLVIGILGRARLARDGGFAQHPCCRHLLSSPTACPAEAGPRRHRGAMQVLRRRPVGTITLRPSVRPCRAPCAE